jgi:hypothetical protein
MMQSTEEHQDIPNEDAAVMLVVEPRKQHRVQNLAAESHQKRKEGNRGYCGSQRRMIVARKRLSHHGNETSPGILESRKAMNHRRNLPLLK